MKRLLSANVKECIGKEVCLQGWIQHIRELGGIAFLILRDRSGTVQVVLEKKSIPEESLKQEMIVQIQGIARAEDRAPGQVEIAATALNVIATPSLDLPIDVSGRTRYDELNLDTLLKHRILSLRHPDIRAIFKVQAEVVWAFRHFLNTHDFIEVHTPKIVASATEGGASLFPVQYLGRRAYLAQSPQFYKQMLVGVGYERVFETGPVFRAEEHNTARHLNQYLSLDFEMGFIDSEEDVMNLETELLRFLFDHIQQESCSEELKAFGASLPSITVIPRMRLSEVYEVLSKHFDHPPERRGDLTPEEERLICQYAEEKLDSELLFVTHYPVEKRPMYAMPDSEDHSLTKSFDLLWRGIEITTGGQRIHNYQMLRENIVKFGLNPDDFSFYLETFAYGMPPHGGLAIGAERLTQKILDLRNIREASIFPRDRTRLVP
ncbi:MAG: aspartate--tRNA(Asn) ligase [Candidatus Tectomicrobia bacterium]|nr:aspartate--tRNA(Asn) ligase [Candidatus Tectomicrobia bacterium]